jgi:hypothetical protein
MRSYLRFEVESTCRRIDLSRFQYLRGVAVCRNSIRLVCELGVVSFCSPTERQYVKGMSVGFFPNT